MAMAPVGDTRGVADAREEDLMECARRARAGASARRAEAPTTACQSVDDYFGAERMSQILTESTKARNNYR